MPLTQEEVLEKIKIKEFFFNVEIGDVDFSGYTFIDEIDFSGAIFSGIVKFQNVSFQKRTNFCSIKFKNKVDFAFSKFQDETFFTNSEFQSSVNFASCQFCRKADFTNVVFENDSDLSDIIFTQDTIFHKTEFKKNVRFMSTVFGDKAIFDKVKFKNNVTFEVNIFWGKTNFESSEFCGIADFFFNRFLSDVSFVNTTFIGKTRFVGLGFEDEELFFKGTVNFLYSTFFYPEAVEFRTLDLSKCKLRNLNVSSFLFSDIRWAQKGKRKVIYDEIEIMNNQLNILYPLIEQTYRQLKINYENSGNYGYAGDFHFGEMEMKRLGQPKFYRYFSLTTLYKILSGYGEKFWWAFSLLFIFLFISSIPYLYTGLKASKLVEENEKPELIKYNLSFNLESFSVGEYFNDYITVLTHSVEIVALKREKLYETYTNYGRIFEFIQIFFITIQTTLCVMALKRKFRR